MPSLLGVVVQWTSIKRELEQNWDHTFDRYFCKWLGNNLQEPGWLGIGSKADINSIGFRSYTLRTNEFK